jgi:hypothetical protein
LPTIISDEAGASDGAAHGSLHQSAVAVSVEEAMMRPLFSFQRDLPFDPRRAANGFFSMKMN